MKALTAIFAEFTSSVPAMVAYPRLSSSRYVKPYQRLTCGLQSTSNVSTTPSQIRSPSNTSITGVEVTCRAMPPIFFSTAHLMLRIRSVMAQSFAEGADCPARIRHTAATARGESDQLVAWQPLGTLDDVASRA